MSGDTRLAEDREFLERSLADLDAEHAAGDLAERDWRDLRTSYEARLAAVVAAIEGAPADASAAQTPAPVPPPTAAGEGTSEGAPAAVGQRGGARRRWPLIAAGVVLVAAVVGGLALRSSSARLPSGVATGAAVGSERSAQLLAAAASASAKGDNLKAVEDYEAVLKVDPNQIVALTGEGWILAQTQQPGLLQQGVGLLSRALQAQPGYPPAHVYRGVAYLSEDDYADAVTDLQWYLGHDPDPTLVARVQSALATAQAGLARQNAAASGPSSTAPAPSG